MKRIFAQNAWLRPGHFAHRVLVEFDSHIKAVRELGDGEIPPDDAVPVDWLTPGFVNAHCHLEYTWLENAGLPRGPVPFGEWMRAIMARRPADERDQQRRMEAMREGARRLLAGGCTTVFDSTTDGSSAAPLHEAGIRHFLFYEVLGLTQHRAEPIWKNALESQQKVSWALLPDSTRGASAPENPNPQNETPSKFLLGTGLNPHAPYSVGQWLRDQLRSDEAASWPQVWHLAESADEEELFRAGEGAIADFFRDAGLPMPWVESAAGRRSHLDNAAVEDESDGWKSSFDFLRAMGQLERCALVFHGNELSLDEARFFAAGRGMVHCPGTHRWFARRPAPLRKWLDAGVNVCLGTDSLASADSLSMLDVIRITLEDNPDVTLDEALTMACVNPWKLGFLQNGHGGKTDKRRGVIAEGAVADLVGIETGQNPLDSINKIGCNVPEISKHNRVVETWVNGEQKIC